MLDCEKKVENFLFAMWILEKRRLWINIFLCRSSETSLQLHSAENENRKIQCIVIFTGISTNSILYHKTDYKITENYASFNWRKIFKKNTLNVWAECVFIQVETLIILKSQTHKVLNYLQEYYQMGIQFY